MNSPTNDVISITERNRRNEKRASRRSTCQCSTPDIQVISKTYGRPLKVCRECHRIVWTVLFLITVLSGCAFAATTTPHTTQRTVTVDQIADAIYRAEGGSKTSHPYGILTRYKHTTPRQACINTIRHALRDWNRHQDFITFLAARYAPIGVANDPSNLNRNWETNVRYFLSQKAI